VRSRLRLILAAASVGSALSSSMVLSADANGEFALEGAGQASCSRFLQALEEDSTEVLIFGGWMHGFLTGVNRYESDTYDVVTWPSQQQQLRFLQNVCQGNRSARFADAVELMVRQLRDERLTVKEPPITVGKIKDGSPIVLYPSTLKRVRQRLNELQFGTFSAPLAGDWDAELGDALLAFQRSADIAQSGLPDPDTLLRLFRE
jgi:hypothetical protein